MKEVTTMMIEELIIRVFGVSFVIGAMGFGLGYFTAKRYEYAPILFGMIRKVKAR